MKNYKEEKQLIRDKHTKVINDLFWKAVKSNAFGALCSILRVGGMSDANWDPFQESRKAFEDYNWILQKVAKDRTEDCKRRIGLLMYCQSIEMTAPHEILANLLRCIKNDHYKINPFGHLYRSSKKKLFSTIPPSAKRKFREIKKLADENGETQLHQSIDAFFNEDVRNAFSHSDYILTGDHFRYTEGGLAQQIEIENLELLIVECFEFYGAFLGLHRHWLKELAKQKKFYKWPDYKVFELLSSEEEGVYGFHVHFSNGSRATYTRRKTGIEVINLDFESDGSINFMCGLIDALEPVWKINGEPVKDWDSLD